LETCPNCKKEFDARKHRHNFGLAEWFTPRMPSTRLAQDFTVRCPECGIAFISSTLRFFPSFKPQGSSPISLDAKASSRLRKRDS